MNHSDFAVVISHVSEYDLNNFDFAHPRYNLTTGYLCAIPHTCMDLSTFCDSNTYLKNCRIKLKEGFKDPYLHFGIFSSTIVPPTNYTDTVIVYPPANSD